MTGCQRRARRCELAGLYAERLALHVAQLIVAWGMAARRMGERTSRRMMSGMPTL